MKIIKRIFLFLIILVVFLFLFRGIIYRKLITYKPVEKRTQYIVKSRELVNCIEFNSKSITNPYITEVINLALSITSQELTFTVNRNYNDPNKLINSKTANCVGYASFFSSTCNYLLNKYKLDSVWIAKPQKGKIFLLGINVHQYFDSNFLKNHDFVIIQNKLTGKKFAVDPTINDYFYINFVTLRLLNEE